MMTTYLNPLRIVFVLSVALMGFAPASRANSASGNPDESHKALWLSRQTVESVPPPKNVVLSEAVNGLQKATLNADERMSFQTYRNGGWDIYTTPGMTGTIGPSIAGALSPNLRHGAYRTAYTSNGSGRYQIYTAASDGMENKGITSTYNADNFSPSWSPDAAKIAFVSNRTGVQQIFSMNASGENQVCLSCDNSLPSWSPTWSPAGDQIAFARPVENTNTGKLYVVSANGGQTRLLRNDSWKYLGNVRWSPNGEWVAFDAATNDGIWNNLWEANIRTGEVRRVYDPGQDLVDAWMGDWSPDGTKLIFTRVEYEAGNQLQIKNTFIEEVSWIGGQSRRINTGSNTDRNPSVQKRIDLAPPKAKINSLPEFSPGTQAPMTVTLNLSDEGISGTSIELAEIQARPEDSANWVNFDNTANQLASWMGKKVFFRVRARDHEGNWSAWTTNPEGDASTTFYSWTVNVNPVDYRSHSISQSAFDFIPKPAEFSTNANRTLASIKALVGTSGTQTITISAPGFNTFTKAISLTADTALQAYLSPRSNKVINGDFENPLENGWQITGTRLPERITSDNYEGLASVNLPPGVFIPEVLPDYFKPSYLYPRNLYSSIGEDKAVTLVWKDDTNNSFKVLYARKPLGGQWPSAPTQFLRLSGRGGGIKTVIDQKGGLHFFYVDSGYNTSTLNYCYKPVDLLDCQESRIIKITSYPAPSLSLDNVIAKIDSSNTLHFLLDFDGIHYQFRTNEGVWSSQEEVVTYTTPILSFDIDPQKGLHLIYAEEGNGQFSPRKIERIRPWAGQWLPPEILPEPCNIYNYLNQIALTTGPNQLEHYFVACDSVSSHYIRQNLGSWVKQNDAPGMITNAMTDERGTVFVTTGSAYYAKQIGKENWDYIPIQIGVGQLRAGIMQLGQLNRTGLLFSLIDPGYANLTWYFLAFDYRAFFDSTTPTLKQVIDIPSDMHKAMLSFHYHYSYTTPFLIESEIHVDVKSSQKTISSTISSSASWQPFMIDVSGFAGQTITLSVFLNKPSVFSFDQIYVDLVSLGGWETPTMLDVTPTRVPNPEQTTTLTITGENFFGSPVVRARNVPASSVTLVNENTIQATWNGTLPAGLLTVEVENPGGALALMDRVVLSGNPAYVYLPLLSR